MLVPIRLAEHAGYWAFPGTADISNWFETCPWHGAGGACILRLPGRNDSTLFADALAREVHAWDMGLTSPRVALIDGRTLTEGLRRGVAAHFGIPPDAQTWQVGEALARLFSEQPTVLIVSPTGPDYRGDLWQDALALRDEISKNPRGAGLTLTLLDNEASRLDGRLSFDFSGGQPAFSLFDCRISDDAALWRAYLHLRLAWEAGGDPLMAAQALESMASTLTHGNDEALERGLNAWARQSLDGRSDAEIEALDAALSGQRSERRRLTSQGLFWRSPGSNLDAPRPWVARALLAANPSHARRVLLRSCLVCGPIAKDLLLRCQEIEQHVKGNATGWHAPDLAVPPEEILELWRRHRAGQDETTVYPTGHPASPTRPEDAWAFASLGQFLRDAHSPLARPSTRSEMTVSRLRNTLAHGHYVCWSHVKGMQRVMASW